ncbi:MAG: molybdenum cofactor guanylyltransferase [Bacteroidia bacterium]|nr:molybdenum cofactor guanylyltransferase [Bacteroidia bacterium]
MVTRISGVILAGGASKRFGGITKANIIVEGSTIISRIVFTINDIFDEKIIVTNRPEEFQEFDQCKKIKDQYLKSGPLGGIHAALKSTSADACFVFAGDMPFLDKKIIEDQIREFSSNEYDVLIPRTGKLIEPLHAIYRKSILEDLENFLSDGKSRAVRDFLMEVNVGYIQIPEGATSRKAFANINSPSDISKFIY